MAAYIGTVGTRILARLLHGTLNAKTLHILVCGDLRVDVVPLENLGERHSQKEEADKAFEFGYELQRQIDEIGTKLQENPSNSEALVVKQADLIQKLEESLNCKLFSRSSRGVILTDEGTLLYDHVKEAFALIYRDAEKTDTILLENDLPDAFNK